MSLFQDLNQPHPDDASDAGGFPETPGVTESLASVFDDWKWSTPPLVEPSALLRLEQQIANLAASVDSLRHETKDGRVIKTLDRFQNDLEAIRDQGIADQEGTRTALRAIWRQTQQLGSDVLVSTNLAQMEAGERATMLQDIAAVNERMAALESDLFERHTALREGLAALESGAATLADSFSRSLAPLDAVVESQRETHAVLQAMAESQRETHAALRAIGESQPETYAVLQAFAESQRETNAAVNSLAESREETRSSLEALSGSHERMFALLETTTRSQNQVLAELEALSVASKTAQSEIAGTAAQGFDKTEAAIKEQSAGLATTIQSLGSRIAEVERHQAGLLDRLDELGADIATAGSAALNERQELRSAVTMLADSFKHLRAEIRDSAGQTDTSIRQDVESLRRETLEAVSELGRRLGEQQRTTKNELQDGLNRGVRDPLRDAVTVLYKQMNDIESKVARTFEALRNADLTIRLKNADALLEQRYRSGQTVSVVELPQSAEPVEEPEKQTEA